MLEGYIIHSLDIRSIHLQTEKLKDSFCKNYFSNLLALFDVVFKRVLRGFRENQKFVGNRANDESQNGCFKKTNHVKFSKKTRIFLTPWYAHVLTCAYQGVKNVRFSENSTCFVFLKPPFWDSLFCLITDKLVVVKLGYQDKESTESAVPGDEVVALVFPLLPIKY